jgi:hypothetical protein
MQVLQAGSQQLVFLELEPDLILRVAEQAGFTCKTTESPRALVAELAAEAREGPLLLFDAADPANLGWFSRCQYYVDGMSGAVLQTPFVLANVTDRSGRASGTAVRLQVIKELPAGFRLPGRQQVSEQLVYSVLASFLAALMQTGVAICGGSVVKPLAGRTEGTGGR